MDEVERERLDVRSRVAAKRALARQKDAFSAPLWLSPDMRVRGVVDLPLPEVFDFGVLEQGCGASDA